MRGRVTWLFVLALGAASWSRGQELPRPKPLLEIKKPGANAPDEKDKEKNDKGKDKDADKDAPEKNAKPADPKGPAESDLPHAPPIYFPLDPFPPPAPPVVDPRTGAWEQVLGGRYVLAYQPLQTAERPAADAPPPAEKQARGPARVGALQLVGWTAPPGRTIRLMRDAKTGAWVIGNPTPHR